MIQATQFRSFFCTIIQVIVCILLSLSVNASDITIITPQTEYALNIAFKIKDELLCDVKITNSVDEVKDDSIVATLGYDALMRLGNDNSTPIIASFISPGAIDSHLEKYTSIFPIYHEPTPADIVNFFNVNFPNSRIGYIYTNNEQNFISEIKDKASKSKVHFIFEPSVNRIDKAIRHIVKKNIDVLFIRENKKLYQNISKRFVLESLLRKRIPVITTSHLLVKVGALASLEVSTDFLISEAAKQISNFSTCDLKNTDSKPYRINIDVNSDIQALYGTSITDGIIK